MKTNGAAELPYAAIAFGFGAIGEAIATLPAGTETRGKFSR